MDLNTAKLKVERKLLPRMGGGTCEMKNLWSYSSPSTAMVSTQLPMIGNASLDAVAAFCIVPHAAHRCTAVADRAGIAKINCP